MACAIRNTPEIHGIKLSNGEGQPVREAQICMFADDTQLSKFEKASGSKINYEKNQKAYLLVD
jgi:hypothetical protein